MREVEVVRAKTGSPVGRRVRVADRWWLRLRGLLHRPHLEAEEGLLLLDCPSIHTFGMRYPIDVAFLDSEGRVVRCLERLTPWRVGLGGAGSVHALELAAGRLRRTGTALGDVLRWS